MQEKYETLKGEERRSREGTDVKEGKADYGAQNKQGTQPRHEKGKGEPDNVQKHGEFHEASNDLV